MGAPVERPGMAGAIERGAFLGPIVRRFRRDPRGPLPTFATSGPVRLSAFDLPGETPTAGRLHTSAGDGAHVGKANEK